MSRARNVFPVVLFALCAVPACQPAGSDAVVAGDVEALHHDCTMGATVRGVDVSEAQGSSINWSQVAASGVQFAIARIADGQHIDRVFPANYAGIRAAGMIRGSYLFWRPQVSAATQAQEILSAVGTLGPGDLPPVIDAECMCPFHSGGGCASNSYSDCVDAATAATRIQDLYDRLTTALGRPPIVYTGTWYWNGGPYLNSRLQLPNAPLWISAYPSSYSPSTGYCPSIDDSWSHWTFWQYSDRGHVPGIASGVDSDVFNGDAAALAAFANGHPVMPPPPPPMGTGALAYPLDTHTVSSYVTHEQSGGLVRFDCQTITRANHKGTDFAVARGTPVHASAPGQVIRAVDGCVEGVTSCGGQFGNHVIIQHANGRATLYAHMTQGSVRVHTGQMVECGQDLGLSGNTGHSTGPHTHFEVRDGVSGVGSYYSRPPTDPFGGRCSTQAHDLWGNSCHPTTPLDDAHYVSSTYPHTVTVQPGQMLTQAWRLENTGTTTWSDTQMYALEHVSGMTLNGLSRIAVSAMVTPHQEQRYEVTFQAPSTPGDYVTTYRMHHGMAAFGDTVQISLHVAAPAGCHSHTLNADVPSGACVQVSYAGCGETSCGWYACSNGSWTCTSQDACMGEAHMNDACTPPPPPGAGCAALSCGDCVADPDCAFCPGTTECLAATDAASCTDGTSTNPGACDVCHPVGGTCADRFECCDATTNSNIECIQGFCEDITMCGQVTTTCDPADTSRHCCGLGLCGQDQAGAWECCLAPNNQCTADTDCCGFETCVSGVCQARQVGESCMNTQECYGASYCLDSHICGF
jgi:murein DD-endopeptidase MepM/ murein hydrolase activator NlpD